jgi:hypothetical protein
VASAIERHGLSGRVLTDRLYPWLLYRFHPRLRVPFTWEYVLGQARQAEWQAVRMGQARVGPYFARYGVDLIVLTTGAFRHVPLLTSLGWGLIHLDDRWFIMGRSLTPTLPPYQYIRYIRPWDNAPVTPQNARQVLEEADRALHHCPDGATFAWAYKAEALRLLGHHREAFEAKLKVPERLVIE